MRKVLDEVAGSIDKPLIVNELTIRLLTLNSNLRPQGDSRNEISQPPYLLSLI